MMPSWLIHIYLLFGREFLSEFMCQLSGRVSAGSGSCLTPCSHMSHSNKGFSVQLSVLASG